MKMPTMPARKGRVRLPVEEERGEREKLHLLPASRHCRHSSTKSRWHSTFSCDAAKAVGLPDRASAPKRRPFGVFCRGIGNPLSALSALLTNVELLLTGRTPSHS